MKTKISPKEVWTNKVTLGARYTVAGLGVDLELHLLIHSPSGPSAPLREKHRMRNNHRHQSLVIFGTGSTVGRVGRTSVFRCSTSVSARYKLQIIRIVYRTLWSKKAAFRAEIECMTTSLIRDPLVARVGVVMVKSGLQWCVLYGWTLPRFLPPFIFLRELRRFPVRELEESLSSQDPHILYSISTISFISICTLYT